MTSPSKNAKLNAWVDEIAALCKPANIHWCDGSQAEYDALCEALSYVSFIFTDSNTAEIFLKEPTFDPEEMLRAIHKRFGVLSVILTDEGLAFDGERITELSEE